MAASVNSENTVKKIYQTVIDEVLVNIREAFLDEGYDEQLLSELKQMWEAKLSQSRALAQSSADDSAAGGPSNEHQSSSHHHHHHHHHHHQAGSSLRLPISSNSATAPTAKEVAHQMIARNANNMSNQQPVSSGSSRQVVDTKPSIVQIMDPHTRAAFQALPQSILYTQTVQHQQQQEKLKKQQQMATGTQLDGHTGGSSSEDEDDDLGAVGSAHGDDDDDDDKTNNDDPSEYEGKEDPDPLNSGDDLTEPSTPDSNSDLFDTENVIVCQYDKITRIKNKWKFHLKDGIMNINGKDYLFSKATGDAEW